MKLIKLDNLKYENLKGIEKAAILLNYLGPSSLRPLFSYLDDADIRKLLNIMPKYRVVPVHVTKKVLEEYYEIISESQEYIFSEKVINKDTITQALGEDRARAILGGVNVGTGAGRTLESLELVDAKSLANFLQNEHPQTIAVILAHLEAEKRSEVLKRLKENIQTEVVLRMANLENVSPELINEIDQLLKKEFASLASVEQTTLGGYQPVADMLNVMDKQTESQIMSKIEERDPLLAEEIRKLMFVFEDIVKIDDRGIALLLKEVPNDKLLLALKTANEDIKNKIFKNLSSRAAEMLKEDLANMGPSRLSDVEAAQSEIVNIARRLEAEGKIMIARGG
ncbi:MAG: flagellar motor switch protein FliG, partial [Bdellovibrionaceae bacterium]|nr:flagellar motor switch protein FliG [Pseudobdellovibrionaceae bacterium]MDW8190730.1 flagellar motor switch protein FliG [Pseudobdellovibrionaceae bacterium]